MCEQPLLWRGPHYWDDPVHYDAQRSCPQIPIHLFGLTWKGQATDIRDALLPFRVKCRLTGHTTLTFPAGAHEAVIKAMQKAHVPNSYTIQP